MISKEAAGDLYKQLVNIPHLDLGISFDVQALLGEYLNLPERMMTPYKSRAANHQSVGLLAKFWHGACLTSPDGTIHSAMTEIEHDTSLPRPTPLADMCPHMMDVAKVLTPIGAGMFRIMLVRPGGNLSWHSHHFDYAHHALPAHTGVVAHIPIIMPERFRYSVTDIWKYRYTDTENFPPRFHNARYEPGRATIFNSYHLHNVFNNDDHDRVSLMLYMSLEQEAVADRVATAIANYSGEYVR